MKLVLVLLILLQAPTWAVGSASAVDPTTLRLRDIEALGGDRTFHQTLKLKNADFKILDVMVLHRQVYLLVHDRNGQKQIVGVTFKRLARNNELLKEKATFLILALFIGNYALAGAYEPILTHLLTQTPYAINGLSHFGLAVGASSVIGASVLGFRELVGFYKAELGKLKVDRINAITDAASGVSLQEEIRDSQGRLVNVILRHSKESSESLADLAQRTSCSVFLAPGTVVAEAR